MPSFVCGRGSPVNSRTNDEINNIAIVKTVKTTHPPSATTATRNADDTHGLGCLVLCDRQEEESSARGILPWISYDHIIESRRQQLRKTRTSATPTDTTSPTTRLPVLPVPSVGGCLITSINSLRPRPPSHTVHLATLLPLGAFHQPRGRSRNLPPRQQPQMHLHRQKMR